MRTCELLPGGCEALRLVKAAFFLSRREFLPLLPQLGLSVVVEVPLIQFSVLSQGLIFPRVVVNWLCPWEEVSSESAYTAILTSSLCTCS